MEDLVSQLWFGFEFVQRIAEAREVNTLSPDRLTIKVDGFFGAAEEVDRDIYVHRWSTKSS